MIMKPLAKQNSIFPAVNSNTPDKIDTYAGKYTARRTDTYNQADGSVIKTTQKINKDGSISQKVEKRFPK